MASISNLNETEKLFLAGCLKGIIMADGKIESEELSDLDSILKVYNFQDYDKYLEKFENEIRDEDSFWKLADAIIEDDLRNRILEMLQELSLQEGYPDKTAEEFIKKLKQVWNISE